MSADASPPISLEAERLQSLAAYAILDTPGDAVFDRITRLAAQLLGLSAVVLAFVDRQRVWIKSAHAVEVVELPRNAATDSMLLLQEPKALSGEPARQLARTLVLGPAWQVTTRNVQFLGAPLMTAQGLVLGVIGGLRLQEEPPMQAQLDQMAALAAMAMDTLELHSSRLQLHTLSHSLRTAQDQLRYQGTHDGITGLWNAGAMRKLADQARSRARREGRPLVMVRLDVSNYREVHDTHGRQAGEEVLMAVASRLAEALRSSDFLGHMGAQEFLCILAACDPASARMVAERCQLFVELMPVLLTSAGGVELQLRTRAVASVFEPDTTLDGDGMIAQADHALALAIQSTSKPDVSGFGTPRLEELCEPSVIR